MVAIREHRTRAAGDAVHCPCDPCPERHHAASECVAVARLDDQMRVVALQRVVDESKARSRAGGCEAHLELMYDMSRTQRREVPQESQRHVRRQLSEALSRVMPHP